MNGSDFNYELLFQLSPDLLCIAGYDGYFKKINPAVSKALGYSMEELYSRPINDFVYQDDKEVTLKARAELTSAKPLFNFENRYQAKTGEIVWLSWTSMPLDSERIIFAVAKDITHKKRLEAERNVLLANLTQVNKELRHLTYTTSHDLRSPVNNLLSVFGLIDISRISDKETLEFLEILQLSGEKLKQTLDNYVDLLNEKHHAKTQLEEVDLHETLEDVLQSIDALIHTSKAAIHHDFSEISKVQFNKAHLKSVFLNLITNSIKYAKPDCPPEISIHTRKHEGVPQLIIEDNGLGLDLEKVKDQIFGLHQKFHNHTDSKGIGLYLVYNHVTSLEGRIGVESKINEGTKFTISFKT